MTIRVRDFLVIAVNALFLLETAVAIPEKDLKNTRQGRAYGLPPSTDKKANKRKAAAIQLPPGQTSITKFLIKEPLLPSVPANFQPEKRPRIEAIGTLIGGVSTPPIRPLQSPVVPPTTSSHAAGPSSLVQPTSPAPLERFTYPRSNPLQEPSRLHTAQSTYTLDCELIYGEEEHTNALCAALEEAESRVEILFYREGGNLWLPPDVFQSMREASDNGIKIQIKSNEPSTEDFEEDDAYKGLRSLEGLSYLQIQNHTKVVISEGLLIVGSCNFKDESEGPSNVSLVLRGPVVEPLKNNFSKFVGHYRRIQSREDAGIKEYQEKFKTPQFRAVPHKYPLRANKFDWSNSATLLTTPNQHHSFLIEAFETAQERIEIYTPFVKAAWRTLNDRFPVDKVRKFLDSGKKLVIVYSESENMDYDPSNKRKMTNDQKLKNYFKSICLHTHKNLELIENLGMHEKMIRIDGRKLPGRIAVGSFNWASAYLELHTENTNNYYDATIVLAGEDAHTVIEEMEERGILIASEENEDGVSASGT